MWSIMQQNFQVMAEFNASISSSILVETPRNSFYQENGN